MKQLIPASWRLQLKVTQRNWLDWSAGQADQLIHAQRLLDSEKQFFQPQIHLTQPIFTTEYSDNKKHNLALAIAHIQDVLIPPNQIFSFWHLVGSPSRKRGYLAGRAIAKDQLTAEIGGGLCQLSGLIYFLILKAGITPLERHPHSKDIYTEENRFAPLGSDATVVYGYKDLRFRNPFSFPFYFQFDLQSQAIQAAIYAPKVIPELRIEFKRVDLPDGIQIQTIRYELNTTQFEAIDSTFYPTLLC
ncbi:VanW family protein [Phormidium sp. CLA17]|uniref:VanW family protein n=1 Tax=Leptolyngbya sp. Cla-17 TaxID=2803751 RepID=UPI001490CEDF|nr:VanW family protein [Leptolyngbya sp. Cla-17]MBM0741906.1 VanW family protein [Leptolyngbya sp. Cla-17]